MKPTDFVDPFLGNTTTDLAEDRGIAMAWSWPKAETGNTHPGACLPFGMVSACAYSGAYVTGYGCNGVSTKGRPIKHFAQKSATGFTHFHPSGTGMIGSYYNYLRVFPSRALEQRRWLVTGEDARPGYYACTLSGDDIRAELSVTRHCAVHRYRAGKGRAIAALSVELSSIGLDDAIHDEMNDRGRPRPTAGLIRFRDDGTVEGTVALDGISLHFVIAVDEAIGMAVWRGDRLDETEGVYRLTGEQAAEPFGIEFRLPEGCAEVHTRIAFSFRSTDRAVAHLGEVHGVSLEAAVSRADEEWSAMLSPIAAKGPRDRLALFYTALYHSLIKPMDCEDENPFYDAGGPCSVDLATLWDQSKSLLPLLFFAYPDQGAKVVATLAMVGERRGALPNALLLSGDSHPFDEASGMAYVVVADAFFRGVPMADWAAVAVALERCFRRSFRDFLSRGRSEPASKTVNLSSAASAIARLESATKAARIDEDLLAATRCFRNAFEARTGLLSSRSSYYEGSRWNYSFSLLPDEEGRLGLFAGRRQALETADRFFGYYDCSAEPAPLPLDAPRIRPPRGVVLERFEGLNNEADMDSPWIYHYLGRPDRTCEVVKSVLRHRFGPGPGGLPGNDDSGGTSSWYVWAVMGLFPVSGTPIYLLTLPDLERIEIELAVGRLVIVVEGFSPQQTYVQSASWNGEPLSRAWLRHGELERGGELRFVGGISPSGWGRDLPPPSFRL